MGSDQSDRYFDFADWMSIGTLSITVLLFFALAQAANPMTIFTAIAIVYGIGLVAGALLAEFIGRFCNGKDKHFRHCRGAQR